MRGSALLPFGHANDLIYFEEDVRHALNVKSVLSLAIAANRRSWAGETFSRVCICLHFRNSRARHGRGAAYTNRMLVGIGVSVEFMPKISFMSG